MFPKTSDKSLVSLYVPEKAAFTSTAPNLNGYITFVCKGEFLRYTAVFGIVARWRDSSSGEYTTNYSGAVYE